MDSSQQNPKRCILGVFAHPDDETSGAAGTITRYVREGVDVYVATATRGELGSLGFGETKVRRRDLPQVREAELRSVLEMYGAHPPILLGYRDQELALADFEELVGKVTSIMERVRPDIVITFGPLGISYHEDHITIHRATKEAFQRFRPSDDKEPRLFYVAIPRKAAERFELDLDGPDADPTTFIDISEDKPIKIKALRAYRSQEDAQWLAEMFESEPLSVESFHQAYPAVETGIVSTGFWD